MIGGSSGALVGTQNYSNQGQVRQIVASGKLFKLFIMGPLWWLAPLHGGTGRIFELMLFSNGQYVGILRLLGCSREIGSGGI